MKIGWKVVSRLIRPGEDYSLFRLSICWRIRDFYYYCRRCLRLLLLLFSKKNTFLYISFLYDCPYFCFCTENILAFSMIINLSIHFWLSNYWLTYILFQTFWKITKKIYPLNWAFKKFFLRFKNNVRLVFSLWRTYYLKQCFLLLKIIF